MPGATAELLTSRLTSDERLATSLVAAVRKSGVRAIRGLQIAAEDGRVILKGLTRSFYDKQLVLHATQQLPGVTEIVDELDVAPVTPRELQRAAS